MSTSEFNAIAKGVAIVFEGTTMSATSSRSSAGSVIMKSFDVAASGGGRRNLAKISGMWWGRKINHTRDGLISSPIFLSERLLSGCL